MYLDEMANPFFTSSGTTQSSTYSLGCREVSVPQCYISPTLIESEGTDTMNQISFRPSRSSRIKDGLSESIKKNASIWSRLSKL